jgi:hypothetical protein
MNVDQLDLKRIGAYLEAHLEGFKGLNKAEKFLRAATPTPW